MTNTLNLFEHAPTQTLSNLLGYTQDLLPFWLLALVVLIVIPAIIIILLSKLKRWLKTNCPKIAKVITITEIAAVIIFIYWFAIKSTPDVSPMYGFWNYNPVFVVTVVILFFAIYWLSYPGSDSKKKHKKRPRRK